MSDAPREEEIYQALAPGGSYKTGLVSPVAAQSDQLVSTPMRFKGAMGGQAVGNDDYPDHEPRATVPYKHYKDLEDTDPKLHEAVTHVADDLKIPRTDLASLVYANSDNNPNASNGSRTGYMGLTPDDARNLDPEGHLNINDPIDNLYLGAMKYKRMANRFGMGSPNAFAAYHGGGDTVNNLLGRSPDEHARSAPDGMFSFLNKVLGRDGEGSGSSTPPTPDDPGSGSDDEAPRPAMRGPQSFPDPGPQMSRARPAMDPDREAALMRSQGPVAPPPDDTGLAARPAPPAGPSSSYGGDDAGWQRPVPPPARPLPATDVSAATAGMERAIGAQRGPAPVPPPPSGERMIPNQPSNIQEEVSVPPRGGPPQGPSQATQDILRDRETQDREPAPPGFYSRARVSPSDPLAPPPPERQEYQPLFTPAPERQEYQPPFTPRPMGPSVSPESAENQLSGPPPPVLTGAHGPLAPPPVPERQEYQPPFTPRTSGGYAVGGAIPGAIQTTPDSYSGQPPALSGQAVQVQPTTGSGAPLAPAPASVPRQAIGTDQMASQLNQQELARLQGNRPDVAPTGPTQAAQAPAPPTAAAAAPPAAAPTTAAAPAAQPVAAAPAAPPAEPGSYTAIGDSLAAHMIRKGGARGQEDPNKIGSYREGDTAVSGWGTQKVLSLIDKIPLGQIQGQNVVLSTGASNSPADLAAVPKQIARLKELGAKSVSVVGVGTRDDFAGVNDKLAKFVTDAKDPSVVFAGALPNVGADKVHSTNPTSVLQSAQQALTKAGGGDPVPTATTGSGEPRANVGKRQVEPTPTTAPGAGGGGGTGAAAGMPAANLPAGAPRALAPPGSATTATSAPPIDRLKGSPTAMTAAGVVRAAASGGSDGVLTYMTRNGPRGMSVGEGWDHTRDLMAQALILQGKYADLHHVDEYIFRMQHKGAMDNVMQAIGNMDDPNTAAQYLAKAHAFVTDGTQVGFQVLDGKIFGQRYDEQTHNKIGGAFQVTEQGLRRQAMANWDPAHFSSNLNAERQTNETGRHNVQQEDHANRQLAQQDEASKRNLQEKQLEYQQTQQRYQDQLEQRKHEKDQLDARQRELQQQRLDETGRQKELDRIQKENTAAQRAADLADKNAQRAAEEKSARYKYADDATDEYFGRGGAMGTVTDPKNPNPILPADIPKARRLFSGILHHDNTVNSPDDAMDAVRGHLAGRYKMAESVGDDGKRYAHIRDENGNVLATVPADIWRMYLPKQDKVTTGASPGGKP